MMKKNRLKIEDFSQGSGSLIEVDGKDLLPLPSPYDSVDLEAFSNDFIKVQNQQFETCLDNVFAIGMSKPSTEEGKKELVNKFLSGLKKLFSKEDNWTFLQPLMYSLEYCAKCQICNEACPIYLASGKQEIYRPTYRGEVLRRIINQYVRKGGKILSRLKGEEIDLNWTTIARLGELAYRCTLCRRCAQWCPLGVDNALISREIRKLFSQEMGIAPKELHESGTIQQLRKGSPTGMSPHAFRDTIEFIEEEVEELTGKKIEIPIDQEGADILFFHNAGEFLSWPENMEAMVIIFDTLGIHWTLSSDLGGYDSVNYGVWYDDIQLARIVMRQAEIAKKLKVKKILVGECGHAHKTLLVIADRILTGDLNIPRASVIPLLEDAVINHKIRFDISKNDFPVTLHDPCNLVRLTGIVEPQRRILRKICPQFREMKPNGVENYCCGGGSGFAIISSPNFYDWKMTISGRMKFKQILEAFQDIKDPTLKKYVCAPCSNCKGQIRDLLSFYHAGQKEHIFYGGLAELIVNAMKDLKRSFLEWEWH